MVDQRNFIDCSKTLRINQICEYSFINYSKATVTDYYIIYQRLKVTEIRKLLVQKSSERKIEQC